MNNFSIAPWKTAHSYDRAYIRTIKDAQGEHIAHVCDLDDAIPEATANARLMAAAPDLLDLLCRALPYVEDAEHDACNKPEPVRKLARQIRAAIARATGDQTVTA